MKNPIIDGSKIGDVRMWVDPPTIKTDEGWKPADGSLVSRKKNPILYSIIGHTYSDEDLRCCNAELFALPNYSTPSRRSKQSDME